MGAYTISGPDGQKVTINAPDGATPDQVQAKILSVKAAWPNSNNDADPSQDASKPQGRQIGTAEALGRGALQGLSFNTSDELYAGGRAILGKIAGNGDTYDTALKEVRDANALASEQNPGAMLGGEVAGGVVPAAIATGASFLFPGAAPLAQAADAKTAAQAASLVSRFATGAKTGAKFGAAYGAGGYEGDQNESWTNSFLGRLSAGAKGAGAGAVAGAVLTPAIDAVAGTGRAIGNQVRALTSPAKFAEQKYGEALVRGGLDNTFDMRNAVNKTAAGSSNAIVGDVGGDPVKTLIRTALNRPNAENEPFLKLLHDRQGQQHLEIEGKIAPRLGDANQFEAVKRTLEADQSAAAHPAYDAAFKADFQPSGDLMQLFEQNDKGQFIRPTIGSIVNRVGRNIADKYGSKYADWADQNGLKFIQQIKQQLDKQIGEAEKGVDIGRPYSADKNGLDALLDVRRQLADGIKKSDGDAVPLYMKADAQFANVEGLKRALELGRTHAQKSDDVITNALADLGPAEQAHYRLGLARGLADKNRVGNKMHDRIGRDWRDPQDEYRIDAMMHPQDASGFRSALEAMEQARDLRRAATGNSSTAKQVFANEDAKQEAQKVMGAVYAAKNLATGNWSGLLTQARNGLKARIEGINPRVAEEILKIASTPARGLPKSQAIDRMMTAGQQLAASHNLSNPARDRLILSLVRAADAGLSGAVNPRAPN